MSTRPSTHGAAVRLTGRQIVVRAVVGLVLAVAFFTFLGMGYRAMESVCPSDRFQIEHFGPESRGSFSMGVSLWPPGFYCEKNGQRVVQLFPH